MPRSPAAKRAGRNVRSQNVNAIRGRNSKLFEQRECDGIRLFAGRAGRAPDTNFPFERRRDRLAQEIEMSGLAKEGCEIRRQDIEQCDQLFARRVRVHIFVILFERLRSCPGGFSCLVAPGSAPSSPSSGRCRRSGRRDRRSCRVRAVTVLQRRAGSSKRASTSRMSPTRPSPRMDPPATPVTSLKALPRLLMTTSCFPINSSTSRQ